MRIWHQSFTVLEDVPAYVERIKKHVDRIKRPDTEVVLHGLKPQTYPASYPGDDLAYNVILGLHSVQWIANALTAAREGYDGFAMCTLFDPLHREIKTVVDMPVVAAGEVCFHMASMCGHRFGLLLFMDWAVPRYQEQIRACGLTERCAAIHPTGMKFTDVVAGFDKPGPVIDKFRESARKLIAAGADVIIPGEIPMNVLLATEGVQHVDNVPIIDSLGITIKMTETMVDLKKSTGLTHSRHGFYNAAPRPDRLEAIMDFYFGGSPFQKSGG